MAQTTQRDRAALLDQARRAARRSLRLDGRVANVLGICQLWVNWVFDGGEENMPSRQLPATASAHNAVRYAVTLAMTDVCGMSGPDVLGQAVYARRNQATPLAAGRTK